MNIIDRTSQTAGVTRTRNGRSIFSRGNANARRNPHSVNAVMLHQTGPGFAEASLDRMNYVIANYIVLRNGRVLYLRPIEHALNSIGTNQRAIDIEIVGSYPSWREIRRAQPGAPLQAPPFRQIRAARELVSYLRTEHALREIYCHAMFTPKNCCGPHLWYNVGEWAIDTLNMSCTRGRVAIRRWWGHPSLEIEPVPASTADQRISADAGDVDEESEAGADNGVAPQRASWECWLERSTRARRVKQVGSGIIGVFDNPRDAAAAARADRPWQKPWGWECWIRKPTRAAHVRLYAGGIIGAYTTRDDAMAERERGWDVWRKMWPI